MNQENNEIDIPTWKMDEVMERMEDYRKNPEQALDFDQAIDEIEREL